MPKHLTLIAVFSYKEVDSLFMLGDGLISNEFESPGNFIMPGSGPIGRPRSKTGNYLEAIEQKVNVIDGDLAFVWSGRRKIAGEFGDLLHSLFHSDDWSFESLVTFSKNWEESLPEEHKDEISIICAARFDGRYKLYNYGAEVFNSYNKFSKLLISGSGRDAFLDWAAEEEGDITNFDQALGNAMLLLTKLYHYDIFDKVTYREEFGGMFELANCSVDGIVKISDIFIATIDIDATQFATRGVAIPLTFFKYDTLENLTILREVKGTVNPDNRENPNMKNIGHAYFPIVSCQRDESIPALHGLIEEGSAYDSKYIGDLRATHVLLMLKLFDDEHVLRIALYFRKPGRDSDVRLELVDGDTRLWLSNSVLESINRNVDKNVNLETGKLKDHIKEGCFS